MRISLSWHYVKIQGLFSLKEMCLVPRPRLSRKSLLPPSDAIWRLRDSVNNSSATVKLPDAPSHCLNQRWLDITAMHPSSISQKMRNICWQKLSSKIGFSQIFMHLPVHSESIKKGHFGRWFLPVEWLYRYKSLGGGRCIYHYSKKF